MTGKHYFCHTLYPICLESHNFVAKSFNAATNFMWNQCVCIFIRIWYKLHWVSPMIFRQWSDLLILKMLLFFGYKCLFGGLNSAIRGEKISARLKPYHKIIEQCRLNRLYQMRWVLLFSLCWKEYCKQKR